MTPRRPRPRSAQPCRGDQRSQRRIRPSARVHVTRHKVGHAAPSDRGAGHDRARQPSRRLAVPAHLCSSEQPATTHNGYSLTRCTSASGTDRSRRQHLRRMPPPAGVVSARAHSAGPLGELGLARQTSKCQPTRGSAARAADEPEPDPSRPSMTKTTARTTSRSLTTRAT